MESSARNYMFMGLTGMMLLCLIPLFLTDNIGDAVFRNSIITGGAIVFLSSLYCTVRFERSRKFFIFSLIFAVYFLIWGTLDFNVIHLSSIVIFKIVTAITFFVSMFFGISFINEFPIIKNSWLNWFYIVLLVAVLSATFLFGVSVSHSQVSIVELSFNFIVMMGLGIMSIRFLIGKGPNVFNNVGSVFFFLYFLFKFFALIPLNGNQALLLSPHSFSGLSLKIYAAAIVFFAISNLTYFMGANYSQEAKKPSFPRPINVKPFSKTKYERSENVGLVEVDPNTKNIIYSNDSALKMLDSPSTYGTQVSDNALLNRVFQETCINGLYWVSLAHNEKHLEIQSGFLEGEKGPLVAIVITDTTEHEKQKEAEKKFAQMMQRLIEFTGAVNHLTDSGQVCKQALDTITESTCFESAAIMLLDEDDDLLMLHYTKNIGKNVVENIMAHLRHVISHKREHKFPGDPRIDERLSSIGVASYMSAPFVVATKHRGAIIALSAKKHEIAQEAKYIFDGVSNQLSISFERNEILESLNQKIKELDRSTKAKDEFIASISHEMRTPLTSVLGYLELTLNETGNLNRKQLGFLRTTSEAANDLLWLIDDIIDLTVLRIKRKTLKCEMVQCESLFNKIASGMLDMFDNKGIIFQYSFVGNKKEFFTNKEAYEKILINIFRAHTKYVPKGQKSRISAAIVENGLTITALDTCKPFTKQEIENIIEPFAPLPTKTLTEHPGSVGLALSVAHEYAKCLGGTITVKSSPIGNRISVFLPEKRILGA